MMSIKKQLGAVTVAAFFSLSGTAHADIFINWTNEATSGFDAAESNVIHAAIGRWESLIESFGSVATTNQFDISIVETATFAVGAITSVTEHANGIPASATMIIDDGTAVSEFSSWFVDSTPLNSDEFVSSAYAHYGASSSLSPASGAIDLFSVVTHELGHALGFAESYSLWDAASNDATGILTYGEDTVGLLGTSNANSLSHLDPDTAPFDLMLSAGTFPGPNGESNGGGFGDRRVQSALDLDILAGVYGFEVNYAALPGAVPAPGAAAVLCIGGILGTRRRRGSSASFQTVA